MLAFEAELAHLPRSLVSSVWEALGRLDSLDSQPSAICGVAAADARSVKQIPTEACAMIEQLDQLLAMHDSGVLNRRQLLGALVATLAWPGHPIRPDYARSALRRGRTLNHVTLSVSDISRSKAFYSQLLGRGFKSDRAEQAICHLENGAMVLDSYEGKSADHPRGIDHFCVGLDTYQAQTTFTELRQQFPKAVISLENGRRGDQVYIRDPDGARVQLCAADYKP